MSLAQAVAAGFTVDHARHLIRFVRDFAAPRAMVFEAWTTPEDLTLWWDATGAPLAECELDLRPGGSFRFVSVHQDMHVFTGTYLEVAPPERLVLEANGLIGTIQFAETAGGTRMTLEIAASSGEQFRHLLETGVAEGTSRTCDNLVAYVDGKTGVV
jgi:uncharacterized protein YndB with AHSA1/START domain